MATIDNFVTFDVMVLRFQFQAFFLHFVTSVVEQNNFSGLAYFFEPLQRLKNKMAAILLDDSITFELFVMEP